MPADAASIVDIPGEMTRHVEDAAAVLVDAQVPQQIAAVPQLRRTSSPVSLELIAGVLAGDVPAGDPSATLVASVSAQLPALPADP